jgi:hypothetical protein
MLWALPPPPPPPLPSSPSLSPAPSRLTSGCEGNVQRQLPFLPPPTLRAPSPRIPAAPLSPQLNWNSY